jgi:ethanolamine utilization protein EutN
LKVCRVLGPVVSTIKHPTYVGEKLLSVQPVDADCETAMGSSYLAVDRAQAGEGDLVLVLTEGTGARQIIGGPDLLPIRSVIVGIVDAVEVG